MAVEGGYRGHDTALSHVLLVCSRTFSTPSGDGQKRPSRDSGKGFLPTVEDRDMVVVLRARDEHGSLNLYSPRIQWQLPQWGAQAAWEKAIQNPGFPAAAFCNKSGEGPETWEGGLLGGDGSHGCVVQG